MTLIIDSASSSRRLSGDELRRWAENHTIFISSEMSELAEERALLADELRELGLNVVMFEDLGGRDEDAVTAYLDGVARSDIYVGLIADRYGRMQPSGRSPTHEEYRFAREHGKRVSIWVKSEDSERQGNARDLVQEVETFHTTGRFGDPTDLARRVRERLAELAADDEAPWIKVGDAVFRATLIRDRGDRVEIEAEIRDPNVAHYLESLRQDQWQRGSEVTITTRDRSGTAGVEEVISEARSTSARAITISARISWTDDRGNTMAAGTGRYSAEDLAELGLRSGLLEEPPPEGLSGYEFMLNTSDPIADLADEHLPEASIQAIARLLVVEHLFRQGVASRIDDFTLGPSHGGRRRLSLTYTEPARYANAAPAQHAIEGAHSGP